MPMFSSPFNFKPFTEDLDPAQEEIYGTDLGGFARGLLSDSGITPSLAQRGWLDDAANMAGAMQRLAAASGGGGAPSGMKGANIFGNLLQSYLRPNLTPGVSFTDQMLNNLRGLSGKSTALSTFQKEYLGNEDNVMRDVQAILAKRLGPYLASTFMSPDFMTRLKTNFLRRQQTQGEKAPDIIAYLQGEGLI